MQPVGARLAFAVSSADAVGFPRPRLIGAAKNRATDRSGAAGLPNSCASDGREGFEHKGDANEQECSSHGAVRTGDRCSSTGQQRGRHLHATGDLGSGHARQRRRSRTVLAPRTAVRRAEIHRPAARLRVLQAVGAPAVLRDYCRGRRARHDRYRRRRRHDPASPGSRSMLVLGRSVPQPRLLGLLLLIETRAAPAPAGRRRTPAAPGCVPAKAGAPPPSTIHESHASSWRAPNIANCMTSSSKMHAAHAGTNYRFPFATGGLPSVMR